MSEKEKPDRITVTLAFEVKMHGWDDDVDWSDPFEVVKNQIEECDWHDIIDIDNPTVREITVYPVSKSVTKRF